MLNPGMYNLFIDIEAVEGLPAVRTPGECWFVVRPQLAVTLRLRFTLFIPLHCNYCSSNHSIDFQLLIRPLQRYDPVLHIRRGQRSTAGGHLKGRGVGDGDTGGPAAAERDAPVVYKKVRIRKSEKKDNRGVYKHNMTVL